MRRRLTTVDRVRVRGALLVLAPGLLLLVLSWNIPSLSTFPGIDGASFAALAMAPHSGITFGSDLVWTYGPLGFLNAPGLWFGDTAVMAFVYQLLARLLLSIALYLGARRSFGPIGGLIVAWVVATAVTNDPVLPVALMVGALAVLERDRPVRTVRAVLVLAGAITALEVLIKLSIGVELVALTVILVLSLPDRARAAKWAAIAFAAVFLVGWLASGQSLGDIPSYLRNGASIVSGYNSAYIADYSVLDWTFSVFLAVALLGLLGVLRMTATSSARSRWGAVALWLVFVFLTFKQGFVRHDGGHVQYAFDALLGGLVAVRWRPGDRALGLAALGVALGAMLALITAPIDGWLDTDTRVAKVFDEIGVLASKTQRVSYEQGGKAAVRALDPLDPGTLALLGRHTVHVMPYEADIPWAYGLRWRPLPVFEAEAAYTTRLDSVNADFARSSKAPERILYTNDTDIDGRVLSLDEPATTRAILCRYGELGVTPRYLVLGRGPNRCGAPRPLGTVEADWGQSVPVPAPPDQHSAVFVTLSGAEVGGLETLRSLLYKPRLRSITLNGGSYRLIPGTSHDGLIMRAPVGVDFSPPFRTAPNTTTVAVSRAGTPPTGGHPLRYAFYAISISVSPRDPSAVAATP